MRSVSFSLCLLAFAIGLASCKSSMSNPAAPTPAANGGTQAQKTISIPPSDIYGGTNYSPRTVTVQVGGTVVWSNRDGEKHTTVSDTGLWSSDIGPGAEFTRTFPTAGKFDFHCSLHPGMTGTVTVQ
jgi:plastocyanin